MTFLNLVMFYSEDLIFCCICVSFSANYFNLFIKFYILSWFYLDSCTLLSFSSFCLKLNQKYFWMWNSWILAWDYSYLFLTYNLFYRFLLKFISFIFCIRNSFCFVDSFRWRLLWCFINVNNYRLWLISFSLINRLY